MFQTTKFSSSVRLYMQL